MDGRVSSIETIMRHPTVPEFVLVVGLVAPKWGLKVVELLEAIRRYRR
jgi:hypothetical protein